MNRRNFLAMLGIGAAAPALPAVAEPRKLIKPLIGSMDYREAQRLINLYRTASMEALLMAPKCPFVRISE